MTAPLDHWSVYGEPGGEAPMTGRFSGPEPCVPRGPSLRCFPPFAPEPLGEKDFIIAEQRILIGALQDEIRALKAKHEPDTKWTRKKKRHADKLAEAKPLRHWQNFPCLHNVYGGCYSTRPELAHAECYKAATDRLTKTIIGPNQV